MSQLEVLRQLFKVDQQVRGFQSRLEGATGRQQQQSQRLNQLEQQKQELTDQIRHVQATANGLERQAQDVELRVGTMRERMNTVTSNKEYSALLIEVNTLKNNKSKLEDEALDHIGRIDQLDGKMTNLDKQISNRKKLIDSAESEMQACQQEVSQHLEQLIADRDKISEQVPSPARAIFERVARIHDGETMAVVVEENRKTLEYSCGGCFLNLPIENVNSLMMQTDQIICCPNCGRILYLNEELKTAFAQ